MRGGQAASGPWSGRGRCVWGEESQDSPSVNMVLPPQSVAPIYTESAPITDQEVEIATPLTINMKSFSILAMFDNNLK